MSFPGKDVGVHAQVDYKLRCALLECPNKGIVARVRLFGSKETHRFLIKVVGTDVVLQDLNSDRTLTLEVTK